MEFCDMDLLDSQEDIDPLADADTMAKSTTTYYRLDEVVFGEPISYSKENSTDEDTEEICFIDNVIVLKRTGKRDKYLIDVDTNSSKPICPQTNCNKTFSTMTLLRDHVRKVHCADRTKYVCEHCAASFAAKYLLAKHMQVHTMERVQCPVCAKMLSRSTNMSEHLRSHTGTRPHSCRSCQKTFQRRAALNRHIRFVHAGEVKNTV